MLATIKLYGHLAKQFGKLFEFDIETVSESIRALNANCAGFNEYLIAHSEPGYRVIVDGKMLSADELRLVITKPCEIKIVPVIAGRGDGKSIGQIIVGVVLVIVAIVLIWTGIGAALLGAYAGAVAAAAASIGVSLIAGGITSLLTATPKTGDMSEQAKQSNNAGFGNNQDTIIQGIPIPVGYGMYLCEGYPVSVKMSVEYGE